VRLTPSNWLPPTFRKCARPWTDRTPAAGEQAAGRRACNGRQQPTKRSASAPKWNCSATSSLKSSRTPLLLQVMAGRAIRGTFATLGDAYMERGEYDKAEQAYQRLADRRRDLVSYNRIAFFFRFVTGDNGWRDSGNGTSSAGPAVRRRSIWHGASLSWVTYTSRPGRLDEARAAYTASLQRETGYHLALAGLGRVCPPRRVISMLRFRIISRHKLWSRCPTTLLSLEVPVRAHGQGAAKPTNTRRLSRTSPTNWAVRRMKPPTARSLSSYADQNRKPGSVVWTWRKRS